MSRFNYFLIVLLPFFCACGSSSSPNNDAMNNSPSSTSSASSHSTPAPSTPETQAMYADQIAHANAYCVYQKKMQIISSSLLSAYTKPAGGNNAHYEYVTDGITFNISLTDYTVNVRGTTVVLNGDIDGTVDSGANFFSTINLLNIAGDNINLDITGSTRDGRADDNFVDLKVTNHNDYTPLFQMNDVSIKKGEFDFGDITFDNLSKIPFKFIDYFNADNTTGLLFLYGQGDDKTIISGDNGMITAVYSTSKQDPGTWLDLPCNQ